MLFCLHLFLINFFSTNLSGIPSKCQTVWIQIRPDIVGPDLGPDCLQRSPLAEKALKNRREGDDQESIHSHIKVRYLIQQIHTLSEMLTPTK